MKVTVGNEVLASDHGDAGVPESEGEVQGIGDPQMTFDGQVVAPQTAGAALGRIRDAGNERLSMSFRTGRTFADADLCDDWLVRLAARRGKYVGRLLIQAEGGAEQSAEFPFAIARVSLASRHGCSVMLQVSIQAGASIV